MRRFFGPLVLELLVLACLRAGPAFASGDRCEADWALHLGGKAECDNVAALAPGNDTRINLLLLMAPGRGLPIDLPATQPVFSWLDFRDRAYARDASRNDAHGLLEGEGSRCRSESSGMAAFDAAVAAASGLPRAERLALSAARRGFKDCGADDGADAAIAIVAETVHSGLARDFVTYLRGAAAFYAGRFGEATKDFDALLESSDSWLAETAEYMVARTEVNALQTDTFDSYGSFAGSAAVDKEEARRAERSFELYLRDHPRGLYVVSARGLLRRVDWLAGWTEKLAARYATLLMQPDTERGIGALQLAEEIDSKLLPRLEPSMTKNPVLLAVLDLRGMRRSTRTNKTALDRATLEGQHDAFASMPALYEFLLASFAFYVDDETTPVLKGVPDATGRRDGDALWFSRQLLRGLALEKSGDRNARGFWLELYPGTIQALDRSTIELALAMHAEKHRELAETFRSGSLIVNPAIRSILLTADAGPDLLRSRSHDPLASDSERNVALYTLLAKSLLRGQYASFLSDVRDVAADAPIAGSPSFDPGFPTHHLPVGLFTRGKSAGEIGCPALAVTVSRLDRDPRAYRDRLCLAEFVRLNEISDHVLAYRSGADDLGSGPAEAFPGKPYSRDATYVAIINDKDAPAADRAYALYRAVKCYEPVGNNECGTDEVSKATRKGWYTALKREYPGSPWSKALQYWW